MNNKSFKKYIPGAMGVSIYTAVVATTLLGGNINSLDLYKFIGLSMGLPIVVALIEGLVTGSISKNFKNNMINILVSTIFLSAITVIFTLVTNNIVGMDILLENTKMIENISLTINPTMTIGSMIQPIMLVLVFSALGNLIGSKLPKLVGSIRS